MHTQEPFGLTKRGPREGQKKRNGLQYPLLSVILFMPGKFPMLGVLST